MATPPQHETNFDPNPVFDVRTGLQAQAGVGLPRHQVAVLHVPQPEATIDSNPVHSVSRAAVNSLRPALTPQTDAQRRLDDTACQALAVKLR